MDESRNCECDAKSDRERVPPLHTIPFAIYADADNSSSDRSQVAAVRPQFYAAPARQSPCSRIRQRDTKMLLTIAALGMFSYGVYERGWGAVGLLPGAPPRLLGPLGFLGFGVLLGL